MHRYPFTLLGFWHLTLTHASSIFIASVLFTLLRFQHPTLAAALITPQHLVSFLIFPGPDGVTLFTQLEPTLGYTVNFFIPLATQHPAITDLFPMYGYTFHSSQALAHYVGSSPPLPPPPYTDSGIPPRVARTLSSCDTCDTSHWAAPPHIQTYFAWNHLMAFGLNFSGKEGRKKGS